MPSITVVIPTLNSEHHLEKCLIPWRDSSLKPKILVIDSSSMDGTVNKARKLGAEVVIIPREEFNHGLTREKARQHSQTDIVVMITDDAYATDASVLEKLIVPLLQNKASVAYARQLPRPKASFFEAFPRQFNYPELSQIRSIKDIEYYGTFTFFCSNSCAAYKNEALDLIGGFPELLLGEDTVATAKLLHAGHSIAYVAEAQVFHSHRYTLKQEFQRYFDTGLARKGYQNLIQAPSNDSKRGASFVRALLKETWKKHPHLLPYACLQTCAKWLGYTLGRNCLSAPLWFKRFCSSQKYYWKKKLE